MKKMRELTSLLLALALAGGSLTGCSHEKTGATLEIAMENSYASELVTRVELSWVEEQIPVDHGLLLIGTNINAEGYQCFYYDTETGNTAVAPFACFTEEGYTYMHMVRTFEDTLEILYYDNETQERWMDTYDLSLNLLESREVTEETKDFWGGFCKDKDGNYLAYSGSAKHGQTIEVYDSDFRHKGTIGDNVEYYEPVIFSADGTPYWSYHTTGNADKFAAVDTENLTLTPIKLPETLRYELSFISGEKSNDFYCNTSNGIYAVNLTENTSTEVLNWINSDFSPALQITYAGEEQFYVTVTDETSASCSTWLCRRRTAEEIKSMQFLTLAAYDPDPMLLDMIYQQNRSNSGLRILVEDYGRYDTESDEDAGIDRFKQDMLSGKIADIISTENLPFEIMASKGMFADLSPFMERDLNMDDYYTNFFDAISYDGKQLQLGFSFTVQTLAAKTRFVGEEAGYTVPEFITLLESLPEEIAPFSDADKLIMLQQLCMYNMGAFVDIRKASCNFISAEFLELLEFCSTFPEPAVQYEIGSEEWYTVMQQQADDHIMDEAVFSSVYINEPGDFHMLQEGKFGGEEITLTGYPTVNGTGNGAVFDPQFTLAMNAQSLYQEESWELMKRMLSEEYQQNISTCMPVLKSELPTRIAAYLEDPIDSTFIGGTEVLMDAPSEEELNSLMEYVEHISVSSYYNKEIYNIIYEEASMYFAGDCTAEEAAEMMQSRVSIYLSEQS